MVQMAFKEIVCNGISPRAIFEGKLAYLNNDNVKNNGTDGTILDQDEITSIDNITITKKASVLEMSDSNETTDSSCTNNQELLLDESADIFSISSSLSDNNLMKDKEVATDSPVVEDKPNDDHNCLSHPVHLSLVNKLDASKNTIQKLEETVKRLENLLRLESEKNEKLLQLESTILQSEQEINLCKQEHEIDQRTIASLKKEMETKLSTIKKQLETANKEKENMVMRYAVSEKELLDCKKDKEILDKKMKEVLKENESSTNKLKTMSVEKAKVSQQLDAKISELSNVCKEIDKLKDEINSRDIKIKWTQNKLKSEMDIHKDCSGTIDTLRTNIRSLEDELNICRQEISKLNLQIEKNVVLENSLKELKCESSCKTELLPGFLSTNKAMDSEFQALLSENNAISQQVENIERIWLTLDTNGLEAEDGIPAETKNQDICDPAKEATMKNLFEEAEEILTKVAHQRKANEEMLSALSRCQSKGAEMLSLPHLKSSKIIKYIKPTEDNSEHKNGDKDRNDGEDDTLVTQQLKSRIEVLESQLVEEKESRELSLKNLARTEEILSDLNRLRAVNDELRSDLAACKAKEAELLEFTQKLTAKNVNLQSEFTSVVAKAEELQLIEKNHEETEIQLKNDIEVLRKILMEEKDRRQEETRLLARQVAEKTAKADSLSESVNSLQSELSLVKNKHSVQIKELQRELSLYRRKIEQLESTASVAGSSANSISSSKSTNSSMSSLNDSPVSQGIIDVPAQVLVERIVKLQQESAKQNDRIEFLEEHSAQLVMELQKKSRLLQNYIMREQTGTLTSNTMDRSKAALIGWSKLKTPAELCKSGGIMASLYSTKPADETMTFELCLEINRKLQAVLEDTLLKNITLKENIDTLGDEIARLSQPKS